MACLVDVPTFTDPRGSLSVVEGLLPFAIARAYYIYDVVGSRGGHRHKCTRQALICLSGNCVVYVDNGVTQTFYNLVSPKQCLLIEPEDWHTMQEFSPSATLLVFASEPYDVNDYIDEPYS